MGLVYANLADLPAGMRQQAAAKMMAGQKKAPPKPHPEVDEKPKRSKYGNRKTETDGIKFDSKKEARRYEELMLAMERGVIYDLRLQEDFTLQEAYTTAEGERIQAIRYRADFTYRVHEQHELIFWASQEDMEFWMSLDEGTKVVEDVKGMRTDVYKMKKKLMAEKGISIREV